MPTDADGHPDWDRATDKVKARFRQLLEDEKTRQQFLSTAAGEPAIDSKSALFLGHMAVGAFFQMQMVVCAIRLKLTREELKECFTPDFTVMPGVDFDQSLTRLVQKRGPEWLAAFADEIAVGGILIMSSVGCWNRAGEAAAKKKGNAEPKKEGVEASSFPQAVPVYQA